MTIAVRSNFPERAFRRPLTADVRRRLESDISIVFRSLNRSDWVREFILGSNVAADLLMLMSPLGAQSSFILETEEHQEGRLTGSIKMRYLVVPSFTTPDGLSGGAIVTTYDRRDHPLHAPSVMANTRIGRYVRDNKTGEWLFLTRNEIDNVTRMQWLHSSKSTTRERICLTCNSTLFNKGLFSESILFECHDEEWRLCPLCHAPPDACCACSTSESALVIPKHPLDLSTVAAAALTEPKSEWFGRVQVSILSNLTKDLPGDVDACMNLRTSFHASQDASLALQMQNLALAERARSVIPKHVAPPKLVGNGHVTGAAAAFGIYSSTHASSYQNHHGSHSALNTQATLPSPPQRTISSNGLLSQFMSEMLAGREEPAGSDHGSRVAKKPRNDSTRVVQGNGNGSVPFGAYSQHISLSPSMFDPMSMVMGKQTPSGNAVTALTHNDHNVHIPQISNLQNGSVQRQVLEHGSHREQENPHLERGRENGHAVVSAVPPDHSLNENGFPATTSGQGHHPLSSNGSNSTKGTMSPEEDDDDDDDNVFETDTDRHRMPMGKTLDSFFGSFISQGDAPAAAADITGLHNLDLAETTWLSVGPSTNAVQKTVSSRNAGANVQPIAVPVLIPDSMPRNPQRNGIRQTADNMSLRQASPVTPGSGPLKQEQLNFGPSQKAAVENGIEKIVGDQESDDNGQPLARLEPRPPGMSASGEGAWMWHMGPRGPFGMAAIAAARERERRAEERRRKNREAAARSNARAKERLERIKGELEKNKNKISRLSRKRKELEVQNSSLKQRLAQHAS